MPFLASFLSPSWDWTALPLFTPFVGPDGSSHHYGGRFLHLDAVMTQGWSIQVLHCHCIHPLHEFTSVLAFPPHVKKLDTYAWKPLSIQLILSRYEVIVYMDASIRLTRPLVDFLLPDLYDFPLRVCNGAYTMDETYAYLNVTRKQVSKRYQKEGTFQLYRNCSFLHERILSHFVDCALHKECIAPAWSSPYFCFRSMYDKQVRDIEKIDVFENIGCHRYDQSALTSILEREFHLPNDSPLFHDGHAAQTRVILRYETKCFTLYVDY